MGFYNCLFVILLRFGNYLVSVTVLPTKQSVHEDRDQVAQGLAHSRLCNNYVLSGYVIEVRGAGVDFWGYSA
jgi:hypothetical protein